MIHGTPAMMPGQRLVTGYARGKPFPLLLVDIDGRHWAESGTASAYLEMREAASKASVKLDISSAWRSHEEQTAIWKSRQDAAARALLGQAATPGWSRHESGRALDIRTGLTAAGFAAGDRTDVYRWLELHAASYGFKRTVASEPWHWEHVGVEEPR